MVRVYYWFKGCPANRPGGPWWHQDFALGTPHGSVRHLEFVRALEPHVRAMCEAQSPTLREHTPNGIIPPPGGLHWRAGSDKDLHESALEMPAIELLKNGWDKTAVSSVITARPPC